MPVTGLPICGVWTAIRIRSCCSLQYPNGFYFDIARREADVVNYPDWVCLLLDKTVAAVEGTLFCPRNAAAAAARADRPLFRADLFDRLTDEPGSYGVAHFHPEFSNNEPCPRVWDGALTGSPWDWLHDKVASVGAVSGRPAWPLDPADARELSGLADTVVTMARQFAPERCGSAAECYQLTRDARETVQLMIEYLRRPDLLDTQWVSPWREAA